MIGDGNNFTFHNVSINTWSGGTRKEASETFTFHNVSINTGKTGNRKDQKDRFTFHNVSINTIRKKLAALT